MDGQATDKLHLWPAEFTWPIGLALDIGNVLMIAVTSVAVYVAWRTWSHEKEKDRNEFIKLRQQELNARKLEQESSSKRLYMDYMLLSFNNPKFSVGRYDDKDEVEVARYDTYLSIVFWSLDEYLQTENDKFCEYVLEGEATTHYEYVRKWLHKEMAAEGYRDGYSAKFLNILDRTIKKIEDDKQRDEAQSPEQ
ncbi:hypothetical protein [Methylobacterium sp. NEAU K]|uniref:hypothetical protein n=1 Tax=Methylobacterium sp. NEAU K TaxID=3064946 RepID=UPI0027357AC4|nr:hypothetical protein [Methylobacterium sp. NEAU K]MDP4005086.1 hypothetical protein [Methylobacterium sp. NEAU K]